MVPIWDDHEVTNDAWKYGAENHQKIEGKFNLRKRTALKAYYEWMPIREKYSKDKGWRNFEIGNLINLIILDTRLSNRDKQVNYVSYINNGKFEKDKFIEDLNNEKRNLIGKEQLRFIAKETKKKFFWNVFGQQVLISKVVLPPLPSEVLDNLSPQATFLKYINNLNLPYNTDAWDGYPAARERFLNSINTSSNNIFLAGDTHNCWAGNIANNSGIFKGVEFGTPSVSSPGGSEEFGELDVRPLEKAVTKINKDRIEKIVIEASEQSNRINVPTIEEAQDLNGFLKKNSMNLIFTDLNSNIKKIDKSKFTDKPVCIIIGPEGDFSETEREKILSFKGVQPIKINENILRSETAVISAISIVNYVIN